MSDAQQRYRLLGKYELLQLLGEGAMGIVWKAYDTELRRYVALKLLSSSFRKTQDMQERFVREARAAGALQHANGRWRRNRKDELNDTRPNRSSQFFETELAEGAGRRDHLNGTLVSLLLSR